MLTNYLKTGFRSLRRQKGYSIINIIGLAIGIAGCILILTYVIDELKYDKHHQNADNLYRIYLDGYIGGQELKGASTPAPMGKTMVEELPEVILFTRFMNPDRFIIEYKENRFNEDNFLFADSSVFDMLSINMIQGDPSQALIKPHTLVITESIANKYFGDENPIGQRMMMEDSTEYSVTGVIENQPSQSHIKFEFLASMNSMGEFPDNDYWVSNSFMTYVHLTPGTDYHEITKKLNEMVIKYAGPQFQQIAGINFEEFISSGNRYRYELEPFTDLYLISEIENSLGPKGNMVYVRVFTIIALIVLLIACVNFMNLSTARSAGRAMEVGVRKVLGSSKSKLISQFLMESILISFMALVVAVLMVDLAIPFFNSISGKELEFSLFSNILLIPGLLLFGIIVGVVSGLYPAFFLSSFNPASILKGEIASGLKSGRLRNVLVVMQFTVSIILIVGTFMIQKQMHLFMNKDLGFDRDQLMIIPRSDVLEEHGEAFKTEILGNVNITNASYSNTIPGKNFSYNAHVKEGAPGEETKAPGILWTDHDFLDTWKLSLVSGRYFSNEILTDSSTVILNEKAVNIFNYDEPLGKTLLRIDESPEKSERLKIIGVVKNMNFETLRQEVNPMIIKLSKATGSFLALRISENDMPASITYIEKLWNEFVPDKFFEYYFFNEDYAKLYDAEIRTSRIMNIFSAFAIFIACLGLFGLSSFIVARRTKEIGVRKVLGASIFNIVFMLSKNIIRLVVIASVLGWVASYFLIDKWLQNFAYPAEQNIMIFLFSGFIALGIALITISYQTIKTAIMNPVSALRYE
ncbi:MAG: FtsX-like permease family protein [Candidatus Marinimicrobia bacterium]|jgi:putative ABC transport system permease protein|nr:FtsX-like permease family protein [Candidatus Neomarinimicrobiota bacterium]MBT3634382.1 FtsX-like permease family protein [Candidatus Neomarinimicrobiota bacterium]MBT3681709.1 FtsX-like permease family protein [Candidatus Neomarinimicrobiota bacterium]MBT3759435.1 FtsX-like permease family protein [Candidatus Neomarinimicrobiota bacterium]MBT3895923.1 FtsX-like permease family protein [Candidatus Neomarinimicrobiota bacterium]